jgi:hypothetical protein
MGVDHSAFVSYGAKVRIIGHIDDLDTWLSAHGKDLGLSFVEWGSRGYGGSGGFIVGDKRSTRTVDFDYGVDKLAIDNPPSRLSLAADRWEPDAHVYETVFVYRLVPAIAWRALVRDPGAHS